MTDWLVRPFARPDHAPPAGGAADPPEPPRPFLRPTAAEELRMDVPVEVPDVPDVWEVPERRDGPGEAAAGPLVDPDPAAELAGSADRAAERVARLLEAVAARLRAGELPLAEPAPDSTPAALAVVLAALLHPAHPGAGESGAG